MIPDPPKRCETCGHPLPEEFDPLKQGREKVALLRHYFAMRDGPAIDDEIYDWIDGTEGQG